MTRRWSNPFPVRMTIPLLIAVLSAAWMHDANAQQDGDVAAGRQLAETWCSSCHVVGPTTVHGTSNGVPTFVAIAGMKATTAMSLRVFLQTPHAQMPDLHLSKTEIGDLAAYILSLRRR
jgi:mono/diheme cytochrome c family protein